LITKGSEFCGAACRCEGDYGIDTDGGYSIDNYGEEIYKEDRMKSYAFVVMPFGIKEARPATTSENGIQPALKVNFDEIYDLLIEPALADAGCAPFRADKEKGAGDIRTDMFFELVTADVIVADISILNPNVFYELGIRHGVAPHGVFMIHGGWSRRPFDIAPDRTFDYDGKLFETAADSRDDAWKLQLKAEVKKLADTFRNALEMDKQTTGSPVYKELAGLKPVDWSEVKTARAKYFGEVFVDWKSRVEVAKLNGFSGDLLTLAGDAPTRFHRGKLLWEAARSLISLYRFEPAKAVLEELLALEPNNLSALTQIGLTLGRLGRINEAKVHMAGVVDKFAGDPESQGILGRIYKDMWRIEWDKPESSLEERQQDAIMNSSIAASAIRSYNFAQRRHLDSYYNGINAVSLVKLLDHLSAATGEAPIDADIQDIDDLIVLVRIAAKAALEFAIKADNHEEAVWATATLGELELIAGDAGEARRYYQTAASRPGVSYFQVDSMLSQIRLFDRLGFRSDAVAAVTKVLEHRIQKFIKPQPRFEKVVLCSGHMIDAPDRKTPRFPPQKEEAVRNQIASQLEEWKVGANDLAICGGARGTDIIFAELCVDREAEVWLFIPLDESEFLEESVRLPNSDWENRFYELKAHKSVKTFFQNSRLKPPPKDASAFARNNLWMINTARAEVKSADRIHAILVWDEQPTGDGPGGTSDFASQIRRLGGHRAIINPTKL